MSRSRRRQTLSAGALVALAALVPIAVANCGSSVASTPREGAATSAQSASGNGGAGGHGGHGGAGGHGGSASQSAASSIVSSSTAISAGGMGGMGGGNVCSGGCDSNIECADDSTCPGGRCIFLDGLCGKGAPGTCKCCGYCDSSIASGQGAPMCLCDGTFDMLGWGSDYFDCNKGKNAAKDSSCVFGCAYADCLHGSQSCLIAQSKPSCPALPQSCMAPGSTCECLGDLGATCSCSQDNLGNLTVTCP